MRRYRGILIYLVLIILTFIAGHFIIEGLGSAYRRINGFAILTAFSCYLVFIVASLLFWVFGIKLSVGKGFLYFALSMTIAGFLIWLGFGNGNYPNEFMPYEFVSAGIWFGFVNALGMVFSLLFQLKK